MDSGSKVTLIEEKVVKRLHATCDKQPLKLSLAGIDTIKITQMHHL